MFAQKNTMSDTMIDNPVLLSTDTLPGFGLDLIFSTAKDAWLAGLDLALWKNFDAWNPKYVAKLSETHNLPVCTIQTSPKINAKELNKALEVCEATGAKHILLNAPSYFDMKSYSFLSGNLATYKQQYPHITFSIINPDTASMAFLPFPKFRFNNIGEIIKKFECQLGFDVANMDEDTIDTMILHQGQSMSDSISICYPMDRKKEQVHLLPGEGTYNLPKILQFLHNHKYQWYFSIKLNLDSQTLVDPDKILFKLQKSLEYITKNS